MRVFEKNFLVSRACAGCALAAIGLMTIMPVAQAQADAESQAEPLIRGAVSDAQRVTLSGNVHPLVQARFDRGRVEDSFSMDRLYLILKRSPERERSLGTFLQEAHTPGAAGYHKWLTPDQFGKRFGATDSDIAAVTAWLESHGLTVNKVHQGRIAIEFSGNAAQVQAAFRTEIHSFSIPSARLANGETEIQYANVKDPQIPASFAPLVAGISPMHSFHNRPLIKISGKTSYNAKTHKAKGLWTYPLGGGYETFELTPADFAVQYDLGPVYAAGTTGAGQSIGILSVSNIDLSVVQAYQTLFNLPANLPTVVIDGNDPGLNDAATEAYLDVEVSGSVAPAAKVVLYTSAGSVLTDPLLTSGLRALEDNQVSVISMSYGECEAALGAAGNAAWAKLWQEAAAQGITGFVSAGDGGSAGCDDFSTQGFADGGVAVNGLGSTPYNVSVGGTDFYFSNYAVGGSALNTQINSYWSASSTAPATSLLKKAPEQVWNNAFRLNASNGGVYDVNNSTIIAGGGGASSAAVYPASGPATGYPKPAWQAGAGVPGDNRRDLPDVSLYAANGPNYIYYPICALPGDCVNVAAGGAVYITSVGGTSASSPAMAGIQALVDQATKSRQGQANYVYYALATKTAVATAKPFTDVTLGGNEVPCDKGTPNCYLGSAGPTKGNYAEGGYLATAGYDRATGLGTVDVATLIKDWSMVAFKPTTTTLSVTPASFAHGATFAVKATVAPKTGTGTPTGGVALISNDPQAYANGFGVFTLTGAAVNASVNNLPGGTYQVVADYSGDSAWGASASAPVTITVTPEKDTLNASGWVLNPTDNYLYPLQPGMYIPYGSELFLDAQLVGVNGAASTLGQNAPATGAVASLTRWG
jgi:subtilase family serine protease